MGVTCHLGILAVLAPAQLRAAQSCLVTLAILLQAERFLAVASPRMFLHLNLGAKCLRVHLHHVNYRVVPLGAVFVRVEALNAVAARAELVVSEALAIQLQATGLFAITAYLLRLLLFRGLEILLIY